MNKRAAIAATKFACMPLIWVGSGACIGWAAYRYGLWIVGVAVAIGLLWLWSALYRDLTERERR